MCQFISLRGIAQLSDIITNMLFAKLVDKVQRSYRTQSQPSAYRASDYTHITYIPHGQHIIMHQHDQRIIILTLIV